MARHWRPPPNAGSNSSTSQSSYLPIIALGIVVLFIGLSQRNQDSDALRGHTHRPPTFNASDDRSHKAWERFDPSASKNPPHAVTPPPNARPFLAAHHAHDGKYHLLLCATGSVATIKLPAICHALAKYSNLSIRIVLSGAALQFLQGQSAEQPHWTGLKHINNVEWVYVDSSETRSPWKRGDSILHIELRRWADLMVIAPLSANALAKMALGLGDNLLLEVVRAWDTTGQIDGVRAGLPLGRGEMRKTIMVAPAMNTAMFVHPVTKRHLDVIAGEWSVQNGGWIELLPPIQKGLACGDVGSGAMREWQAIVSDIERKFPGLRVNAALAETG